MGGRPPKSNTSALPPTSYVAWGNFFWIFVSQFPDNNSTIVLPQRLLSGLNELINVKLLVYYLANGNFWGLAIIFTNP